MKVERAMEVERARKGIDINLVREMNAIEVQKIEMFQIKVPRTEFLGFSDGSMKRRGSRRTLGSAHLKSTMMSSSALSWARKE